MKVSELKHALKHAKDDDDVVVPIETMTGAVGGHPYVEVKSAHPGIDWDRGKVFIYPEQDVHVAGPTYQAEQKASWDKGEALAFIWMTAKDGRMDPRQKLNAIRSTLRRFGFNHGIEGDEPEKSPEPSDA